MKAPVQMLAMRRARFRLRARKRHRPSVDGATSSAPVTASVSWRAALNGFESTATPDELRTRPPCSDSSSTSYTGRPAYRFASSKAAIDFTEALQHEIGAKGVRVQAVLPGATRTDFWALAGLPVEHLPSEIVMSAEDMVDASLVAFDQGEVVTIPALPDLAVWTSFEAARAALGPFLSSRKPAARLSAG